MGPNKKALHKPLFTVPLSKKNYNFALKIKQWLVKANPSVNHQSKFYKWYLYHNADKTMCIYVYFISSLVQNVIYKISTDLDIYLGQW